MSYVPPSLRNKQPAKEVFEEPPKPVEKPYEEEFPSLISTSAPKVKVWGGSESFAKKAQEWSVYAKEKEFEVEAERQNQQILNNLTPRNLPRFHNVRRFIEEDSDKEDDSKSEQKSNEDDEGWIEVKQKRRVKKAKTMEEIASEVLPVEEETGDTVWGEEQPSNETCWDDRY